MQGTAPGQQDGPSASSPSDLIHRKAQKIKDLTCSLHERALTEPPTAPVDTDDGESLWSRRYNDAAQRYDGLDLCSQEAVVAVIDGLLGWLRLVPQQSVGAGGLPEPANKWGLGPERCVLRAIHSHLVAIGQPLIAERIRSEMADLLQTAESLDECYQQPRPDPHAKRRLVATARIQTKALIKLLSAIPLEPRRPGDHEASCRRGRGAPRRKDPARDRRLMAEWARARGKAGMSRKEFCIMKKITLQTFIRAQDRFRKQARATDGEARR